MIFMLDSMIYDQIVDTPGLTEKLNQLSGDGAATILCTHIQEDELDGIPDKAKRVAVAKIVRKRVATSSAVYGVSRYGEATYGGGEEGGIGIDDVRTPSRGHTKDALIATTAARDADVLVTEDIRLANRLRVLRSSCELWGFEQFRKWVLKTPGDVV